MACLFAIFPKRYFWLIKSSIFRNWREVVKSLVHSEKEILDDASLEGDVLRTLVTYLRSPTLVSDLLELNSTAETILKQAMIDLRKDYVLETVGTSNESVHESER